MTGRLLHRRRPAPVIAGPRIPPRPGGPTTTVGRDAAAMGLSWTVQHALATPAGSDERARAIVAISECGWTAPDAVRMALQWLAELAPAFTPTLWADLCRLGAQHVDTGAQITALVDDPNLIDGYLDDGAPCWDRAGYRDQVLDDLRSTRRHEADEMLTVARWMAGAPRSGVTR